MRILHVNEKLGTFGGVECFLNRLLPSLKSQGLEIGYVYENKTDDGYGQLGLDSTFQISGLCNFKKEEIQRIENDIENLVKKFNPEIIHLHSIRNPFAIRKFVSLRPTVWFCHDYYFTCLKNPPNRFSKFFKRAENFGPGILCAFLALFDGQLSLNPLEIYRRIKNKKFEQQSFAGVKKITVDSEYVKKTLMDSGFDEDLIAILPTPINLLPSSIVPLPGRGNILYASRLEEEKGILVLINSLKFLETKDYHLKIAGTGSFLEKAKAAIQNYQLESQVEFLGHQNQKELGLTYSWADVVIVPSIWPEPFGMIGVEAASFGRPVVGFNVGGISEWLKDGQNGLFSRYNDPKDLASKIDLLLNDKAKSAELGSNGRQMVIERFTLEKYRDDLMKIYQEIAA